ncbi:carbohydrate kinase family protein [Massilia agri]|uniref:Carbohydrate kinase family protein n=1 Tax=Massilia agri TaxID=1886785 RepID=A0ABT2AKH4_9BURK|nr:carbohydrate kinase family protein [Massilia agri]MCS0596751.1 carbohydrate kinase family protein [Massilia agri]
MVSASGRRVLVAGGVGIDTIVRVPSLPLAQRDSIHVPPVADYVAHTGNGVALGLLALGHRPRLIDFIGADPQAELVHERYRERGLDFDYLVHPSGTRRSVNLVEPGGRRLSLYDGRHPDSLRMPRDFYLPRMRGAEHVHLSIVPWAAELFDDAAALGLPVSTDLHDWDGSNPYYHPFAWRADLVFLSAAALGEGVFEAMRAILRAGRARVVVATDGAAGSYALARDDGIVRHTACADPGGPVVDSNGAGDAFSSAFLHAWFEGAPLEACMRTGAIGGAFACRFHGTAERSLGLEELARFRQEQAAGRG